MSLLRLRLTGSADDARGLINMLTSIEGIEHVEEIADLMPHLDDEDSSSAGLRADAGGESFLIEVEVPNENTAGRVRTAARELARLSGAALEFEEDEAWGDNDRVESAARH